MIESYTENRDWSSNYYKLYLKVAAPGQTYVAFNSKPETGWMEMLGMIGGNLGVYLGFSIWGSWQFLVFVNLWYGGWKEKRAVRKASDEKARDLIMTWLSLAAVRNMGSATKADQGVKVEKDDLDALRMEFEKLIKRMEKIEAINAAANPQTETITH